MVSFMSRMNMRLMTSVLDDELELITSHVQLSQYYRSLLVKTPSSAPDLQSEKLSEMMCPQLEVTLRSWWLRNVAMILKGLLIPATNMIQVLTMTEHNSLEDQSYIDSKHFVVALTIAARLQADNPWHKALLRSIWRRAILREKFVRDSFLLPHSSLTSAGFILSSMGE